jgi:hypothetical protein
MIEFKFRNVDFCGEENRRTWRKTSEAREKTNHKFNSGHSGEGKRSRRYATHASHASVANETSAIIKQKYFMFFIDLSVKDLHLYGDKAFTVAGPKLWNNLLGGFRVYFYFLKHHKSMKQL